MSQISGKNNKSESFSCDIDSKEEIFGKKNPEKDDLPKNLSNVNNNNGRRIPSIRNNHDNINNINTQVNLSNEENPNNPNNKVIPNDNKKNENNQTNGEVQKLDNIKEIKEKKDDLLNDEQNQDDNGKRKSKSKSDNSQFVQYVFDSPKLDSLINTIEKYTIEVNSETKSLNTQHQNLTNKIDQLISSIGDYSKKIDDVHFLLAKLVAMLIEERSQGRVQNQGSEKKDEINEK